MSNLSSVLICTTDDWDQHWKWSQLGLYLITCDHPAFLVIWSWSNADWVKSYMQVQWPGLLDNAMRGCNCAEVVFPMCAVQTRPSCMVECSSVCWRKKFHHVLYHAVLFIILGYGEHNTLKFELKNTVQCKILAHHCAVGNYCLLYFCIILVCIDSRSTCVTRPLDHDPGINIHGFLETELHTSQGVLTSYSFPH